MLGSRHKYGRIFLFFGIILSRVHSQSMSYLYTGTIQTFTVPPAVASLSITAVGAQGGQCGGRSVTYYGGLGGLIVATVSVTPLSTLYVYVGGAGPTGPYASGGYNGGGGGSLYSSGSYGGGGGGASDVRTVQGSTSSWLVVAGGGGGKYFCHFIFIIFQC